MGQRSPNCEPAIDRHFRQLAERPIPPLAGPYPRRLPPGALRPLGTGVRADRLRERRPFGRGAADQAVAHPRRRGCCTRSSTSRSPPSTDQQPLQGRRWGSCGRRTTTCSRNERDFGRNGEAGVRRRLPRDGGGTKVPRPRPEDFDLLSDAFVLERGLKDVLRSRGWTGRTRPGRR